MFNFVSKFWEWLEHWLLGEPPDHQPILELRQLFEEAVNELAREHNLDLSDPRVQQNMRTDCIFDLLVTEIKTREFALSTDPVDRSRQVRAYVARRVFSAHNLSCMRERSA